MSKSKKTAALLLTVIMIFSFVLSPVSAVYASKQPATLPIKPPSLQNTIPKLPELPNPDIIKPVSLEAPAKAQGVNYETKEGIKRIPAIQNIHRGMGSSSNPEC